MPISPTNIKNSFYNNNVINNNNNYLFDESEWIVPDDFKVDKKILVASQPKLIS